ncbi:MAG: DUF5522 domain-containing protein [Methylobacter sp.]|nr:DUF5522 domain-containing protein [Methylobacter sp.]
MKTETGTQSKFCSKCNAVLACGSTQAGKSCWCTAYPAIMVADLKRDCLCADCLSKAIQEKITEFINTSSQQEVITVARNYRGNDQLIQGIDYSIENDTYVFTQWYHLKRGSCCGNGCKNCPY